MKTFELPASNEHEILVLGSMLTSINSVNSLCSILSDNDFYNPKNRLIFRSICNFYKKDLPVDVHIIKEHLKVNQMLDNVGGVGYLNEIASCSYSSINAEEYANILKDKTLLRDLIKYADKLMMDCSLQSDEPSQILEEYQKILFKLSQTNLKKEHQSIKVILDGEDKNFTQQLQERQEYFNKHGKPYSKQAVLSHFYDIDNLLGGLMYSNLVIIGARPGMGKTAFGLNIVENAAFFGNVPIGVFSLEMTANQLATRIVSSQSHVNQKSIRDGSITNSQFQDIVVAVKNIESHGIFIDDQESLKISEIKNRARRMKEAHNIGLLLIDYLQLIKTSSDKKYENRQLEVAEISRELKSLAKELNIPVVCLAQLSRKADDRQDKTPQLTDLKESGAIEQEADVVILLHRPDYYDPNTKPGVAYAIIAKNRHGNVGKVELCFQAEYSKFVSSAKI